MGGLDQSSQWAGWTGPLLLLFVVWSLIPGIAVGNAHPLPDHLRASGKLTYSLGPLHTVVPACFMEWGGGTDLL